MRNSSQHYERWLVTWCLTTPSVCNRTFAISAHHSTDGLGVLCKLATVLLLFLLHPPLHFLPFHSLLAGTEGWSASSHLVNETAQPPPIRTHAVLFIVDHLWGWKQKEPGCYDTTSFILMTWIISEDYSASHPCNPQSPPCLGWAPHQALWWPILGQKCGCFLQPNSCERTILTTKSCTVQ